MKQKWIFLLLLLLAAGTTKAEWLAPDPTNFKVTEIQPGESENDHIYYLYEASLQTFFSQGNKWSAEASFGNDIPKKFFFSKYMPDGKTWDGVSYRFNNWVSNKSFWDHLFITHDGGAAYVVSDCTMGGNGACRGDDYWCFEWTTDGTVRVYVSDQSATYGETEMGGRVYLNGAGFPDNTRIGLSAAGKSDVEFNQDLYWTVVDAVPYDKAMATYKKAEQLQEAIWDAESKNEGIDLSSVQAVYDNTASTEEQLQAALDKIPSLVRAFLLDMAQNATLNAPVNLTQLLATPDYAVGNANGWEGDGADIRDGSAQLWAKVDTFDFYQKLTDLPNGVYRINVQGFYRPGNTGSDVFAGGVDHNPELYRAFVYGQSQGTLLRKHLMGVLDGAETTQMHSTDFAFPNGLYVPNRQSGFTAWADLGYYADNATYVVVSDGTLRLGLYCDYLVNPGTWTVFDNWTLEYCGNADDCYLAVRDQYVNLREFDDTKVQATLRDRYTDIIATAEVATTAAEVMKAYEGLAKLQDQIAFNIIAFEGYMAAVKEVQDYLTAHQDFSGPARTFLEEYLISEEAPGTYPNGGHVYITLNTPLNDDQLAQEAAYVRQLLQTAIQTCITEGTDITHLLANSNMAEAGYKGWHSTAAISKDYDSGLGETAMPVAQAFKTPFELSQTLENMPDGIYEVNVNALFRWGGDWAGQDQNVVPIVLYLNEFSTPIQNVTADMICEDDTVNLKNCYVNQPGTWPYDNMVERDGKKYYSPNSVSGCSYAFMGGRYKQTVYGLVTNGKLTLGLRDSRKSSAEWSVFSNFKLTYQAKNAKAMEAVLADLQQKAELYVTAAANGKTFYTKYYQNIQDIVAQFNAASDVDAKYNCLIAINEQLMNMSKSSSLYRQLENKLDVAYSAYWEYSDSVEFQEQIQAFMKDVYDPLTLAIADGTLDNETAAAKLDMVRHLPLIDVVYVFGDLVDQPWGTAKSIYPITRQADGTYQGEFVSVPRVDANGYGNRSGVYFHYQGTDLSASDQHKRDATGAVQKFALVGGSDRWFATYGGRWKATFNATLDSLTLAPVGEPLYPDNVYVVGDLKQGYWNHDKNEALPHLGNGVYAGVITVGSKDSRFTIFAGPWSIRNKNWGECRLGTSDGITDLTEGQTITDVARFYNDASWRVQPGTYLVQFSWPERSLKLSVMDLAGEGSVEAPFEIANVDDLDKLRALIRVGQTTYARLTADIDMSAVEHWMPIVNAQKGINLFNRKVDFDGQQHVIRNFNADCSFFGTLCGNVRNVGFENANVQSLAGDGILAKQFGHENYYTALGNRDTTVIENVWVAGNLSAAADYAGALAGRVAAPTIIRNSYTHVAVSGEAPCMGGLVGQVSDRLQINDSYAAGSTVQGGGIIGGGQDDITPASAFENVVVWNNTDKNFGPVRQASSIDVPQADLLDVQFNADGTATDLSPMAMTVDSVGKPVVEMNDTYKRNSAHFTSNYGGDPANYYRINFAGNQKFIQALSDGHAVETLFAMNFDRLVDKEAKMFSATQSGGVGFLVGQGNRNYHIGYIAHVGGSYKWAESQIIPQSAMYYHLVASWDKEKGTLTLYINGVKHAETEAVGDLQLPEDISRWFCIGGDPATETAQSGANFEVVNARIYGTPLTAKNAYDLYHHALGEQGYEADKMVGISYYDATNWSQLQSTVVAWNPELWKCDMQQGHYPVFAWDTTGGNAIECIPEVQNPNGMVQIFDMNGRMCYQGQLRDAHLSKGVYIISTGTRSFKVSMP